MKVETFKLLCEVSPPIDGSFWRSTEPGALVRCGAFTALIVMVPAGLWMLMGSVALKSVYTCRNCLWFGVASCF